MTRDLIESAIRDAYAARLKNDPDELAEMFSHCTRFTLSGDPEISRVAGVAEGREAVAGLLAALIANWRWKDCRIDSILVDGDHAAVRYRLTLDALPSGQTVETDIADFIRFSDGRIVEFTQFVDTALAARING